MSLLVSEPWMIDRLTIERKGDAVVVDMNGWAFPDPDLGASSPATFLINGKPFAELQRVSAPGAVLQMTVHGRTALDYSQLAPDDYRRLEQRIAEQGLYFSDSNSQIDGHAEHDGEYVNVFHGMDYLRQRWGRRFEIAEILPGYIFTHDLVVMRRRA